MKVVFLNNVNNLIRSLINFKAEYLYRECENTKTIITKNTKYIQTTKHDRYILRKYGYIFSLVKKNVNNYIKNNSIKDFEFYNKMYFIPSQLKENENIELAIKNHDIKNLKASDLNHAYWRIAYINGFIDEKTYELFFEKMLPKQIVNAAIGSLGSVRKYDLFKGNEKIGTKTMNYDRDLQTIRNFIRLKTVNYMYDIKDLLEKDFFKYKVDCVYYNAKRKKIVSDFFSENKLGFKDYDITNISIKNNNLITFDQEGRKNVL